MPTYEYESVEGEKGCPTCNAGFEVRHGMNEPSPTECPRCGGKVSRVISAPGLSLRYNEKSALSDDNLKRHGFKKLVNEGGGKFGIAT